MFYTYVLQSLKDGSTYIGSTKDLRQRVSDHNHGKTKSIRHKRPLKLIYYEAYETMTQAKKREIQLKKYGQEKDRLYVRLFNGPIV